MQPRSLLHSTAYAQLLQALQSDQLGRFEEGTFRKRPVNGRDYWYFKPSERGRPKQKDRYVGPDTPEIAALIAEHDKAKTTLRERRDLVRFLSDSYPTGRIPPRAGAVIAALAEAGIFRKRAVVVGTTAFQAYGPMLGVSFPGGAHHQTEDIDIAQFPSIAIAVNDPPDEALIDTLRRVEPDIQPTDMTFWPHQPIAWRAGDGFRVEFLSPNRGPDRDEPQPLPAIGAQAQPLRYLDFLIYRERPAALLHGGGVLVNVPRPERFALHKLIVSDARQNPEKAPKDLAQAQALIAALAISDPLDLRLALAELRDRGPKWRERVDRSVQRLDGLGGDAQKIATQIREWEGDRPDGTRPKVFRKARKGMSR